MRLPQVRVIVGPARVLREIVVAVRVGDRLPAQSSRERTVVEPPHQCRAGFFAGDGPALPELPEPSIGVLAGAPNGVSDLFRRRGGVFANGLEDFLVGVFRGIPAVGIPCV